MTVSFTYPIDELRLADLISDGWTHLELFSATTRDGNYTTTGVRVALVATTFSYTITDTGSSPGEWFKVVLWDGGDNSSLTDARPFHGGGGVTLAFVREQLMKRMHDGVKATTTSAGGTTTAICSNVNLTRRPDDYFNGRFFYNLDNGEWSQVTDWVQSTATLTFSPAISSVGSGVDFMVISRWTPDEYRDAIHWACETVYPVLHADLLYEGLRTQDASADYLMQYFVSSDMRSISSVEMEEKRPTDPLTSPAGSPWHSIPFDPIKVGMRRGFEVKQRLPDARRLRVWGTGVLQQPYNDSDTIDLEIPEVDLIVFLAASHLYETLLNDAASSDRDVYKEQSAIFRSLYNDYKPNFSTGRAPQRLWSPLNRWGRDS